ncbi:hypothetical protein Landi51_08324 [Colletotrichum acutatum]
MQARPRAVDSKLALGDASILQKKDDRRGYHAGEDMVHLGVIFRDGLDSFEVTVSQIARHLTGCSSKTNQVEEAIRILSFQLFLNIGQEEIPEVVSNIEETTSRPRFRRHQVPTSVRSNAGCILPKLCGYIVDSILRGRAGTISQVAV